LNFFIKKTVKIRCNSKKTLLLLHEVEELLQTLSQNNLLTFETLLTKETLKNQNQQTMKALLTILLSVFLLTSATANSQDGIKIGTTGKSSIAVKFISKKVAIATITITNEAGVVVSTQTADVVKGDNSIVLTDVAKLAEGTFTVSMTANGKTETTKFVNFKMDEKAL
jgi:hypothetical protein